LRHCLRVPGHGTTECGCRGVQRERQSDAEAHAGESDVRRAKTRRPTGDALIHCPRVPGYGTTECGSHGVREPRCSERGRVTQKHTRVRATRDAQTRRPAGDALRHCPRVPGYGTTECGSHGVREPRCSERGRVTLKHTRVRATRDAQTRDAQTCAYPCTQVARRAFLRCERARAADQSLQAGPARGVLCFLGRYFRRSCCHRALVSDRFCLSILYPPTFMFSSLFWSISTDTINPPIRWNVGGVRMLQTRDRSDPPPKSDRRPRSSSQPLTGSHTDMVINTIRIDIANS
jgi:hypothetical protein